jgi:hypothetical protein
MGPWQAVQPVNARGHGRDTDPEDVAVLERVSGLRGRAQCASHEGTNGIEERVVEDGQVEAREPQEEHEEEDVAVIVEADAVVEPRCSDAVSLTPKSTDDKRQWRSILSMHRLHTTQWWVRSGLGASPAHN